MNETAPAQPTAPARQWNKSGLKEFRDSLSLSRREEDDKKLERMLQDAEKYPLMKEALHWAKDHGIEFIIDRNLRSAAGVYHYGTGVLAVSIDMLQPDNRDDSMVTLVHEIRHAWQDWNGLLPTTADSFTEAYFRQTVLEADADAFGKAASQQMELMKDIERLEKRNPGSVLLTEAKTKLDGMNADPEATLWKHFTGWYASPMPLAYGVMLTKAAAEELGVRGAAAGIRALLEDNMIFDVTSEFQSFSKAKMSDMPRSEGVSVDSGVTGLAPLGRGFSGEGNYFDASPQGYIEKNILNPAHVKGFYQPSDRQIDRLGYWVEEVIREEKNQREQAERAARAERDRAEREKKMDSIRAERERNRAARGRTPRSPGF